MIRISMDNQKPVCENFLGNGAVYHCYAEMPDENGRNYTPELAEIEADRVGKMRLKYARTFYKWYAWDAEKQEWNWESTECQVLYRWLKRMQDRGISVILNTGWCHPGDVFQGSWNGQNPFYVPGDPQKSADNYADWVSETAHQLIEVRGFTNIKVFLLFTEPQNNSGPLPEGYKNTYETYKLCSDAVHAALARDGRRNLVQIMGPNEVSKTHDMLKWIVENVDQKHIDIYSGHNYQFHADSDEFKDEKPYIPVIRIPGGRIWRKVLLKQNTDYTVRARLRLTCEQADVISGTVSFGAFSANETPTAGQQPTTRLTQESVKLLDAAEISENYQEFMVTFNSETNDACHLCAFFDVAAVPAALLIESLELCETATGKNIAANSDFSDVMDSWHLICSETACADAYWDWKTCSDIALRYVPKNKLFIFDEYGMCFEKEHNDRPDHGANLAVAALALMNSGVNGSLLWTLFDQQWPNNHVYNADAFVDGDHRWGVAPNFNRSMVPHLSYYAFSLLSRYTGGENSKVYAGDGQAHLHATLNEMADGNLTVVVVNNKACSDEFCLQFTKPLHATLYRHAFDPATCVPDEKADILPADLTLENVGNRLSGTMPPYSVFVYTTYTD